MTLIRIHNRKQKKLSNSKLKKVVLDIVNKVMYERTKDKNALSIEYELDNKSDIKNDIFDRLQSIKGYNISKKKFTILISKDDKLLLSITLVSNIRYKTIDSAVLSTCIGSLALIIYLGKYNSSFLYNTLYSRYTNFPLLRKSLEDNMVKILNFGLQTKFRDKQNVLMNNNELITRYDNFIQYGILDKEYKNFKI